MAGAERVRGAGSRCSEVPLCVARMGAATQARPCSAPSCYGYYSHSQRSETELVLRAGLCTRGAGTCSYGVSEQTVHRRQAGKHPGLPASPLPRNGNSAQQRAARLGGRRPIRGLASTCTTPGDHLQARTPSCATGPVPAPTALPADTDTAHPSGPLGPCPSTGRRSQPRNPVGPNEGLAPASCSSLHPPERSSRNCCCGAGGASLQSAPAEPLLPQQSRGLCGERRRRQRLKLSAPAGLPGARAAAPSTPGGTRPGEPLHMRRSQAPAIRQSPAGSLHTALPSSSRLRTLASAGPNRNVWRERERSALRRRASDAPPPQGFSSSPPRHQPPGVPELRGDGGAARAFRGGAPGNRGPGWAGRRYSGRRGPLWGRRRPPSSNPAVGRTVCGEGCAQRGAGGTGGGRPTGGHQEPVRALRGAQKRGARLIPFGVPWGLCGCDSGW